MKKPKVLGKFVYLTIPEKKETKLEVDHNTKEALEKEWMQKLDKVEVWAVGENANPAIKEGDFVLFDPSAINTIKMVPFKDENGNQITKALILDYHIVHIWP